MLVSRATFSIEDPWEIPAGCERVGLVRATDGSAPRLVTTVAAMWDDYALAVVDENASRFSRRGRVRRPPLRDAGVLIAVLPGALRRLTFLLLCVIAPLALADSGVWGERGIVRRLAVRAPLLFAADGRGVAI